MAETTTPLTLERARVPGDAVRTGLAALVLLSLGHFFIDLYSGALGALQPRLVDKLGLSLTQAGMLGGALIFSSSVCQPLYGYLSDRFHTRVFTVLSPAVAGIFISSLGMAPGFGWLLALVMAGGAGIAAFHPQATARVTQGVSTRRATWMAVFISAGTFGMACGPAYFLWAPQWLGLERMSWAAAPGVVCSVLLWLVLPEAPRSPSLGRRFDLKPLEAVWKPLALLYFCVFVRSVVQISFTQFLPLYLYRERGYSLAWANYTLSLYIAAGALGGVVGGRLADRIGGRRVIMLSFLGSAPLLAWFLLSQSAAAVAGLWLGGLILLFTIPVNVVMAQELAPQQTGTVSALMMGFAWGLAGFLFIPLVGWASDHLGMYRVLASLSVFPLIGFFLARALPELRHGR